ncbi:MAG: alpha-isopropylmalate synthase regulatory domain-containing protein [Leptolyngbyaceae cyanobacterium]
MSPIDCSRTALITANVFQNCLSRSYASRSYHTNILRRLIAAPIRWYISDIDFDLAFTLRELYKLDVNSQESNSVCQEVRKNLHNCHITPYVLEESQYYAINFYDALRLACAIEECVDYIVTWEPASFVRSPHERKELEQQGFFNLTLGSEDADTGMRRSKTIGVFPPNRFWSHLQNNSSGELSAQSASRYIHFESLSLQVGGGSFSRAEVFIRNQTGHRIRGEKQGFTPCEATLIALDLAIDQCFYLPHRELINFSILPSIGGPKALVEVSLDVECAGQLFPARARHNSVYHACAEAYINAINEIADAFHLD